MNLTKYAVAVLLLVALYAAPAQACGFGEAPGDCGQTAESDARYILLRVVAAIKADEAKALRQVAKGENGFRTQDTYVFCVGPDGVMSAHPSPALQGQNVRELQDHTGNHFIATMMNTAKPGVVDEIRYLFPKPGTTAEVAKTTYYTRAADQVCGVGVYEADIAAPPPPPPAMSPQQRVAQLRARLGSEMPANLEADWTAFLQALDDETSSDRAVLAKVRELTASN